MKGNMKKIWMSLALSAMVVSASAGAIFATTTNASADTTYTYLTKDGWTMEETAAVRITEPNGIRFTTTLSETKEDGFTYGTLLLPADMLGGEELTHATASAQDILVATWQDEEETTYTTVLVGKDNGDDTYENLPESYYNRPIAARSYAYDPSTKTYYYTENTAVRSIGYVAYMAKQDGMDTDLINDIVSKTKVELVFNETVSVHNDTATGNELIYNEVSNVSSTVAALKIGGIIDQTGVGEISYTTSDSGVISVDGETLTAEGEGKATITATCTINGEKVTLTKTLSTTDYAPQSQYKILTSSSATTYETKAADLLQKILKDATGVELEIVAETGSETTNAKYLSVGETNLAKANVDISDLTKKTSSRVKTVGNTVFLRGVTEMATFYGAQELLGDCVGYAHAMENSYNNNDKEEFTIVDKDYIPDIEYEVMQYLQQDVDVLDKYAVRPHTEGIIPLGGDVLHNSVLALNDGMGDTNQYFMSSSEHKEWYATTKEMGVTIYHTDTSKNKLELCYTAHGNTEDRAAMIESLATKMYDAMMSEDYLDYTRIAFSQMDHSYWCECSSCTSAGNPSDNVILFVLDAAASLKTKLEAAGDARAETFTITSLFYHATNLAPSNLSAYTDKLTNYGKHLEIWFGETGADYVDPIDNTDATNNWNESVYASLQSFADIANTYGAKLLWWNYFNNATCFFIPYDSFDAIRGNYKIAADLGVDYIFGQMMSTRVNWTRLKQYLMSELRWNSDPSDEEWNAWIDAYMVGAFGAGATEMHNYFNAWNTWADENVAAFRRTDSYDKNSTAPSSFSIDVRSSSYLSQEDLQAWINYCDKAIAALDVNGSNYSQQYNNILLEKLTPLYLMMYIYGGYSDGSFSNTANVIPYAADFIKGVDGWFVETEGENVSISDFRTAVANAASGTATDATKRTVVNGSNLSLENAALATGSYTLTVKSLGATEDDQTTSVTVSTAGRVTIALSGLNLTAGNTYSFNFATSSVNVTFGNVFVISGYIASASDWVNASNSSDGYYIVNSNVDCTQVTLGTAFAGTIEGNGYIVSCGTDTFLPNATLIDLTVETPSTATVVAGMNYILAGESDLWLYSDVFVKGNSFAATANGKMLSSEVFIAGKFKASIGASAVAGQSYEILVEDTTAGKAYLFNVMGITKYITTVADLQALAVGGANSTDGDHYVDGYYVLADDLDCGGALMKAAYNYGWSRFRGTLDGNGHTISNFVAGEGGIFGGMIDATVKNLNIANASINTMSETNGWNYGAIFANVANNTTFENVTIQLNDISWDTSNSAIMTGVLVSHGSEGLVYRNVSIDLTSCTKIPAIFGMKVVSVECDNVTVRVANGMADSLVYAYSDEATTELAKPDGVKLVELPAISITYDGGAILDQYEGDAESLFADGSYVFEFTSTSAWDGRSLINVDPSMDYVSVEFVLPSAFADNNSHGFIVWTWNNGSIVSESRIYGGGGYIDSYATNVVIEDANGNDVTTQTLSANTLYIMKVYYEGATRIDIGTGVDGTTMYFANVSYGETAVPRPDHVAILGETSTEIAQYDGDQTALGFTEDTYVFAWTTASTWGDRARINADASKDYISFDFVLSSAFTSGTSFTIWTATDYSMSAQYNINATGGYAYSDRVVAIIQDTDGNDVTRSALSANTMYKMTIYLYGGTNVQIGAGASNTIYIANIETGVAAESAPTNAVAQGDSNFVLPKYTGDETTLGFADGTYVQQYVVGEVDFWGTRALLVKDGAKDYVSFEFSLSQAFTGSESLVIWATTPSGLSVVGRVGNATFSAAATGFNAVIQDANGNDVTKTTLSANTWYKMKLYYPEATLIHVGLNQANTTMYMANLESGNDPDVFITQGDSATVLPQYMGDETAFGYEKDTYVQYYAVGNTVDFWGTRALLPKDGSMDYVSVDIRLSTEFTSGEALVVWATTSSGLPVAGRVLGAGGYSVAATGFKVVIQDAEGNIVTNDKLSANTWYRMKFYLEGSTMFHVGINQTNITMYMANVQSGNDPISIGKENSSGVVEELAQYMGDETALGFAADSHVFRMTTGTTGSAWDNRAMITADSTQNCVSFEFVLTQELSSYHAITIWVVKGGSLTAAGSVVSTGGYASSTSNFSVEIYDANGNNVTDSKLSANTVYTMKIYSNGGTQVQVGYTDASLTVYMANVKYSN